MHMHHFCTSTAACILVSFELTRCVLVAAGCGLQRHQVGEHPAGQGRTRGAHGLWTQQRNAA